MTRRGLLHDRRGLAAVEFAFVAPIMLMMLMGFAEFFYQEYMQVVLTGEVQKAGRDSTLEGNGTTAAQTTIDDKVRTAVRLVNRNAQYSATRTSYSQYGDVGGEYFISTDSPDDPNAIYNKAKDCFVDVNGNGKWDAALGSDGQGGDSDAVVYTGTVTYPRLFPIWRVLKWLPNATLTSTTIFKNQPINPRGDSTRRLTCP